MTGQPAQLRIDGADLFAVADAIADIRGNRGKTGGLVEPVQDTGYGQRNVHYAAVFAEAFGLLIDHRVAGTQPVDELIQFTDMFRRVKKRGVLANRLACRV